MTELQDVRWFVLVVLAATVGGCMEMGTTVASSTTRRDGADIRNGPFIAIAERHRVFFRDGADEEDAGLVGEAMVEDGFTKTHDILSVVVSRSPASDVVIGLPIEGLPTEAQRTLVFEIALSVKVQAYRKLGTTFRARLITMKGEALEEIMIADDDGGISYHE